MRQDDALPPETTVELVERAKAGDHAALNRLMERCVPPLRRWARGRLPRSVREIEETSDLVQDTVVAALRRLDRFEPRHEGALQVYLRDALANRIGELARRTMPRPLQADSPEDMDATCTSPLQLAIGRENLERYETALARLRPADREAVVGRIELQYGYDQLAVALAKPTPGAARVAVTRALHRLAEEMCHAS